MAVVINGIGRFEKKYGMLYRPEIFHFLGLTTYGLLKFNCLETGGEITTEQNEAYKHYIDCQDALDLSLTKVITEYKTSHNIRDNAPVRVSSVEFAPTQSYFLLDLSWDEENGLVAVFDNDCNIELSGQDEVL